MPNSREKCQTLPTLTKSKHPALKYLSRDPHFRLIIEVASTLAGTEPEVGVPNCHVISLVTDTPRWRIDRLINYLADPPYIYIEVRSQLSGLDFCIIEVLGFSSTTVVKIVIKDISTRRVCSAADDVASSASQS
jgi:hypothetical protein